jgi:eukaryotic-like serine/threonine-protein kinase
MPADKGQGDERQDHLEGRTLGGRFLLKHRIGKGGFGAVYEGVDLKFDSIVAVKVAFGLASSPEAAFRKEAKLARRFKHPNVVEVYDYGVDEGVPYIVMEFLRGPQLDQLVARYSKANPGKSCKLLPDNVMCKFVGEIASALQNAHEQNLVHRDLKPNNIMLIDEGKLNERFVLLDFGISAQVDAQNTIRNATLDGAGTPEYMSPEQILAKQGEAVSPKADIYAFGVILYKLMVGRAPFPLTGGSQFEIADCFRSIVEAPPPKFRDINAGADESPEIEELVLQCLAKKPEDRPASMQEVQERFLKVYQPMALSASTGRNPGHVTASGTIMPPGMGPGTSWRNTDNQYDAATVITGGQTSVYPPVPIYRSSLGWILAGLLVLGTIWLASSGVRNFVAGTVGLADFSLELPETIEIVAGEQIEVRIPIRRSYFDSPIELTIEDVPEVVTVNAPAEAITEDMATLTLTVADLNAVSNSRPIEVSLSITAQGGGLSRTGAATLTLKRPEIWLPTGSGLEGKFVAVDGAPLVRSSQGILSTRIERIVDADTRVEFVLVPENPDWPVGAPRTFYIMKHKVWNSLYRKFSGETDASPRAKLHERLPAVNVTAGKAYEFAQWLCGPRGNLPSDKQWLAAAGFYDHELGRLPSDWLNGPYREPWDQADKTQISVNRGEEGPRPVGQASRDESYYGCRDMAGNGEEWTSTVYSGVFRDDIPIPQLPNQGLVRILGMSHGAPEPVSFSSLGVETSRYKIEEKASFSPNISFRVVLDVRPNTSP